MITSSKDQPITKFVNPALLECMDLLKEFRAKIDAYYKGNKHYHDCISVYYASIDGDINATAGNIADIIGYEVLEKYFHSESES